MQPQESQNPAPYQLLSDPDPHESLTIGKNVTNEELFRLEGQLATPCMRIYKIWLCVYSIMTVGAIMMGMETAGQMKWPNREDSDFIAWRTHIVVFYVKTSVDILTIIGCVIIWLNNAEKNVKRMEKIVWVFWVNIVMVVVGNVEFLLVVKRSEVDWKYIGEFVVFVGLAFYTALSANYMKKTLAAKFQWIEFSDK